MLVDNPCHWLCGAHFKKIWQGIHIAHLPVTIHSAIAHAMTIASTVHHAISTSCIGIVVCLTCSIYYFSCECIDVALHYDTFIIRVIHNPPSTHLVDILLINISIDLLSGYIQRIFNAFNTQIRIS